MRNPLLFSFILMFAIYCGSNPSQESFHKTSSSHNKSGLLLSEISNEVDDLEERTEWLNRERRVRIGSTVLLVSAAAISSCFLFQMAKLCGKAVEEATSSAKNADNGFKIDFKVEWQKLKEILPGNKKEVETLEAAAKSVDKGVQEVFDEARYLKRKLNGIHSMNDADTAEDLDELKNLKKRVDQVLAKAARQIEDQDNAKRLLRENVDPERIEKIKKIALELRENDTKSWLNYFDIDNPEELSELMEMVKLFTKFKPEGFKNHSYVEAPTILSKKLSNFEARNLGNGGSDRRELFEFLNGFLSYMEPNSSYRVQQESFLAVTNNPFKYRTSKRFEHMRVYANYERPEYATVATLENVLMLDTQTKAFYFVDLKRGTKSLFQPNSNSLEAIWPTIKY